MRIHISVVAVLTSLLLISCNSKLSKIKQGQGSPIDYSWFVTGIGGSALSIDPEHDGIENPLLNINSVEMQYNGTDGCNHFTGTILELDETHLKFGIAAGTRKMCNNMKVPDLFNATLLSVSSYKIEDLTLVLLDKDGGEVMQLKQAN